MGIQFTGLASGLDTQSIIADLMQVENMKVEEVEKQKIKAEWKKDAYTELNTKIYSFYKKELFAFKSEGTYNQKTVTSSDESVATVGKSPGAINGSHEITVANMAKGSHLTSEKLADKNDLNGDAITNQTSVDKLVNFGGLTEIKMHIKTAKLEEDTAENELTISATDTLETIMQKVSELDADLVMNYDEKFDRIFVSSTKTGESSQIEFAAPSTGSAENTTAVTNLMSQLGFASTLGSEGENAEFSYNGTDLVSETNEIALNGLSLTIRANEGTTTIAATTNTDAVYDSVKSFVLKYNELTLEMSTKLEAESARTYAPLTSEEKSAMTDDDIELWEAKIKDSLLRRDTTLTSLQSEMRSTLTISSGISTKDMNYKYMSDLGIVTGSYTEGGILHIEGDEDEPLYSVKDNKLKAMIEDDPDGVMEFFTALGDDLYKKMSERMKSSSLSSAFNVFNDKFIDDQVDDYDTKIADLADKLAVVESRYYKQFTAMEQAIQQSNSTGDWLAQQLSGL